MNAGLSVGETFAEVFSTYRGEAKVLLPLGFGLFFLSGLLTELLGPVSTAASVAAFAAAMLVFGLYQGIALLAAADARGQEHDRSAPELIRAAAPFVPRLAAASLAIAILVGLGLGLLVVPGLFAVTIWAVVWPVIVFERSHFGEAFGRSQDLVSDHGWPVCGAMVAVLIVTVGEVFGVGALVDSATDVGVVKALVPAIASAVVSPLLPLTTAALYFRLQAIDTRFQRDSSSPATA